jgi:uncharacterized membrane protein
MSGRGLAGALTLAGIAMVAGIVHILSLLVMPRVAPDDAFARIVAFAPAGVVTILPRAAAPTAAGRSGVGDSIPSRDPSVATAVCRYDLGVGPMRVVAVLGSEAFLALSLHSRSGVDFYGLNDRAGNDGRLELVVMTAAQLDAARSRDSEDSPVRDVRVVAPESRGFVTFDVLPRVGGYAEAERDLGSVSCKVEH